MDRVHRGGPWTGSMGWSMDRVHRGGPWTRVHVLYTSNLYNTINSYCCSNLFLSPERHITFIINPSVVKHVHVHVHVCEDMCFKLLYCSFNYIVQKLWS